MRVRRILLLASMLACSWPALAQQTWYVRPDGGTRYSSIQASGQCDGLADVSYASTGGTGVNQHCAFGEYQWLWQDGSYTTGSPPGWGWVIAGGDTVIVRGGPWRIGWRNGSNSLNGSLYYGLAGDPFGSGSPPVPNGTASRHTRIFGENYASCSAGDVTDRTKLTQVFGGFGVAADLNLSGSQYVDISCIEITRHSQCIRNGLPAYPSSCATNVPLDDYDGSGIITSSTTANLTLTDLWDHGHTSRGIIGPIGANVTCIRCNIGFNGMAGWDFDDGSSSPFGTNASWNLLYSTIEWNGCNQEYPIVHAVPVISCYGQSSQGYGDGVGTPANTGTGMSVNVDHSVFRYNTQDGLDLLHMDAGTNTVSVTNSSAYGNNGQSYKLGPNFQTKTFINNRAVDNCLRLSAAFPGAPSTYNTNLGDFCRAADAVLLHFRDNETLLFAGNTIVTYAPTTYDILCDDPSCANTVMTFRDNLTIGYDNPATYASLGGQAGGPGDFYNSAAIGHLIEDHNLWFGMRNIHPTNCPAGDLCTDPQLTSEPTATGSSFVESELDNFNFQPSSGSPLIGAGIAVSGLSTDGAGTTRPNPPSIGVLETISNLIRKLFPHAKHG